MIDIEHMQTPDQSSSPSGILIRKGEVADIPALSKHGKATFLETFEKAYQGEPAFFDYVDEAFTQENIRKEMACPQSEFWIMEKEGSLLGYAKTIVDILPDCISEGKGYALKRFYFYKKWHGKGLAHRLMKHCLDQGRKNACNIVWLGVWPQNTRAIKFYNKYDFQYCGEVKFTLGKKIEWDWVMSKRLEE